uniref:Uncharacterized protein n=1 Tax=Rhizophora mucronata TaxID=61149 RepID=A0A2P2NCV1_RHIMU
MQVMGTLYGTFINLFVYAVGPTSGRASRRSRIINFCSLFGKAD